MIKPIFAIAAAALAMPAFAQSSAPSTPATADKAKDPKRKICERIERIGSRLATTTVCRTAAEWEELRRNHRHDVEGVQRIVNQEPSGD